MSLYEGLEDDKDKGDSKADLCKYISTQASQVGCHFQCVLALQQTIVSIICYFMSCVYCVISAGWGSMHKMLAIQKQLQAKSKASQMQPKVRIRYSPKLQ